MVTCQREAEVRVLPPELADFGFVRSPIDCLKPNSTDPVTYLLIRLLHHAEKNTRSHVVQCVREPEYTFLFWKLTNVEVTVSSHAVYGSNDIIVRRANKSE